MQCLRLSERFFHFICNTAFNTVGLGLREAVMWPANNDGQAFAKVPG